MTPEVAVQWVAYAGRVPVDDILALGFTGVQLAFLGAVLEKNRLLNPPRVSQKIGVFECQCGCGLVFERMWTTRRPKYFNRTHQMRAYRARKRKEYEKGE